MRASTVLIGLPLAFILLSAVHAREVLTGVDALGTWEKDAPGVSRHIRPADLPQPTHHENDHEAADFDLKPKVVDAPQGKMPDVPKGFAVQVFATGLKKPRVMRVAPNGDVFVAESESGRVLIFPADAPKRGPAMPEVFAENLERPYGIAFHPPSAPKHVYVGAANQVCSLPISQWRPQGPRTSQSHYRGYPHVAPLDARLGGLSGRQTPVRLDRLGFQCCRCNAEKKPGGNSGL